MAATRAWLLDLYLNQAEGITLWFITEDDRRICLRQRFPVTFYAAGQPAELRRLWKLLQGRAHVTGLARERKQDVFVADPVDVLAIHMDTPSNQLRLFGELEKQFPELVWYDADVTIQARYIARHGGFPMAFCELETSESGLIEQMRVLNSRWDLQPELPPLRHLEILPDCDPARAPVRHLTLRSDRFYHLFSLDPAGDFLHAIQAVLLDYDPDFIITDWGDSWVIPFLLQASEQYGIPLRLNRDRQREVRWQKETSYFSYGHIIFRPEEAHLYGRCHIDRKSAMMWSDYSLAGTLEMARVTTLPIEKAGRVSPGQGISAMQVITALQRDVLVPYQKRQVEDFKTGLDLIQSDRGGLVYQPILGLHTDVAQVDFVSMYPAVIIKGNISPEVPLPNLLEPAHTELGVVPATLEPLYDKRVALKKLTRLYEPNHPMVGVLKARSSALKWLLVVCFGFLGYKNARYGRIEAHEAVTKGGREVLLRAKEVAEAEGFEVLHMYVDALWIKKPGCTSPSDFEDVIEKINRRTRLTINLDGVFRWIAFLPSKTDARIPIANRFFGVFQSGELKVRGLETRRRDTPVWIAAVQQQLIQVIGEARSYPELQPALQRAYAIYEAAVSQLKAGMVPPEKLVINGKVSYALEAYKSSTASVRAARQMQAAGLDIRPGQRIRFIYTNGDPDVFAWDLGQTFHPERLNLSKYLELLAKAGASVFQPFGYDPALLQEWTITGALQLGFSTTPS